VGLHSEQADLMISALEIADKKAIELMIPIKDCFMIDYEEPIDKYKIKLMLDKGYSRIPCHSKNNRNDVLGIIRMKQLIGVDFGQGKSVKQLGITLFPPLIVKPDSTALDLLREFKKGRSHMALITENPDEYKVRLGLDKSSLINVKALSNSSNKKSKVKILGLVTLEDVLEKMINIDILDEDDYAIMNRLKNTNRRTKSEMYSKNIFVYLINNIYRTICDL
jgi:metal transporter CNNM